MGKLSGMGNAAGSFERQLLISYLDEEIMVSAATISHLQPKYVCPSFDFSHLFHT